MSVKDLTKFQKMCEFWVTAVSRSEDSVRTKDSKYRANTASRVEHLLLGNKFRQISMTPPLSPLAMYAVKSV